MSFVALKPCSFAGNTFRIGEDVPEELVHNDSQQALITMGVIARKDGIATAYSATPAHAQTICAYIHADEGDVVVSMSQDDVVQIFDVLQATAKDAEDIVSVMDNVDALFLLSVIDTRKTIKSATEARAKELQPVEEQAEVAEASAS